MKAALLALLLATPAYCQTYEPTLVQPVILGAPTTMTSLGLGDDSTQKVDLGFDFPYWDQTFSSAWISSNGFISFESDAHLCCNGRPIAQAQRNTIYGFWTDLISTINPFYKRTDTGFLVGWYGTQEFPGANPETFEINLFKSGDIQFNFGEISLSQHVATVGITGPTWDDNIQLFFGGDPSRLRFQSGLLTLIAPKVDCAVTPLDPSCPPASSPAVQEPVAEVVTIADAYRADVAADASDIAASTMSEPEQVIDIAVQTDTAKEAAPEAERLSPDQVAALSAGGNVIQEALISADPVQMSMAGVASSSSGLAASGAGSAVEAATSVSSPSSVANTNEVLAMSSNTVSAENRASVEAPTGGGQSDDFVALSAPAPAFAAYTQVALQDRPDFYAPRDIYRNRKLRDANFEMYRMSQTNNAKWKEMVDAQYGQ